MSVTSTSRIWAIASTRPTPMAHATRASSSAWRSGHADELADMLLAQADQVARRDHLAAEIGEIVKQHGGRESGLSDVEAKREQLLTAWRTLWEPCGIAPPRRSGRDV